MATKKPDSPFNALEKLRDQLPVGSAPDSVAAIPKGPARAVVRLERKHRRGKEVTVVEKLNLPAPQLELWCRELKQALGCGGVVEHATIVLQGDLRPRVVAVLAAKGVAKVTISG